MKVSKKNQSIFIETMKKELLKIGAIPYLSDPLQFDLNTKFGVLWIRIDYDQNICYSVFSRFIEVSTAPIHLDGINNFSGKWNHFLGPEGEPMTKAAIILDRIKNLL